MEESFRDAVAAIEEVVHGIKPADAWRDFGDLSHEEFFRAWPDVRAWGEVYWRLIEKDRGDHAEPVKDEDEDRETGGGG